MFQQLKRSAPNDTNSTSPTASETDAKKARVETKQPLFFGPFSSTVPEVVIEPQSDKKADLTVKLKKDAASPYEKNADTGLFLVKHSHLGPDANINDRFHPQTPDTAKFQVILVKGVTDQFMSDVAEKSSMNEDELAAMKKSILDAQDEFIDNVIAYSEKMLRAAWDAKLPLFSSDFKKATAYAKKEAKKNPDVNIEKLAEERFLENARTPWNEVCPEDGEPYMAFKATRKYQFTNKQTGETSGVRRPTIWKKAPGGGYIDISEDTKFVGSNSLVYTQVSLSAYTSPVCYGIKANMGYNVILAHKPSKKQSTGTTSSAPEFKFDALF